MKKTRSKLTQLPLLSVIALIAGFAITVLFASCQQPDNITNITYNTLYKDAEEESHNFVSEAIPIYNGKTSVDSPSASMFVRFYDDDKYIPYVAVQYYLENFADIVISKTSYADHKYKYYSVKIGGKSFSLTVDAENDTIYCPEWGCFVTQTSEENQNSYSVLNIMQRVIGFFQGEQTITFDLHKYGFKIYGGTDDAYIPLCIMNQLFSCSEFANYVFNGEAVYYADYNFEYVYDSFRKSPWYTDENGNVKERPQELIDASYNLLCFTHDYLNGQSGYYGFADTEKTGYADPAIAEQANALSFDELLNKYTPDVKTQLLSSSYKDYVIGLRSLFLYTYGDVHSSPSFNNYLMFTDPATINEIYQQTQLSTKVEKIYSMDGSEPISKVRESAGKTVGLELLAGGKTAVIRFDSFFNHLDEWETYYDSSPDAEPNPESVTIPDDTYGFIYKSFYSLLNDETYDNVKNIIIDVSCNSGGLVFCAYYFLANIIGSCYEYEFNVRTGTQNIIYHNGADLNLDGKIDEEDQKYGEKIKDRFNFAVLTSFRSFSCGNAFPCICANNGIPIIGEKSGGGSCAVGVAATADGLPYWYSKAYRYSSSDGTSFEFGAPITVEMPYEDFYDDAKLIAVMEKLYGK